MKMRRTWPSNFPSKANGNLSGKGSVSTNCRISPTSFRIYIDNYFPSTMGTTLFYSNNATLHPNGCFTEHRTLTIPSDLNTTGFYWIYWKIDNDNATTEYNEEDNTVHSAMNLNVI
jgi:hypothetical protein